jgi:hypothetical protein
MPTGCRVSSFVISEEQELDVFSSRLRFGHDLCDTRMRRRTVGAAWPLARNDKAAHALWPDQADRLRHIAAKRPTQ